MKTEKQTSRDWMIVIIITIIFVTLLLVIINLDYFFPTPNPEQLARQIIGK